MQIVDHSFPRNIYRLERKGRGVVMNDALDYPCHQTLYCNFRDTCLNSTFDYLVDPRLDYAIDRLYYEKFMGEPCDTNNHNLNGETLSRCINWLHRREYIYGWSTLELMRHFVARDLVRVSDPENEFILWEITVEPGKYLIAPDGQVIFNPNVKNRVPISLNILQ